VPPTGPAALLHRLLQQAGRTSGTVGDACQALAGARRPSTPAAARIMLQAAADAGLMTFDGEAFVLAGSAGPAEGPEGTDAPEQPASQADDAAASEPIGASHPLRLISIDVEAAVRTRVDDGGAVTRAIWQVGAVRFGPDHAWVDEQPRFSAYVELPEQFEVPAHRRELHASLEQPAAQAMAALSTYLHDADMVVAYNGHQLDFSVLNQALTEQGHSELPQRQVDGLYLAYCLWPDAPDGHRLHKIVRHAGLRPVGQAHDATDDAANLAALMTAGARLWTSRDPQLQRLLCAVTADSDAWRMLRALAGLPGDAPAQPPASVDALLARELSGQRHRRGRTAVPLQVNAQVKDSSAQVDANALARLLHGSSVEPRPAQQQVTDALRTAASSAVPALIEAPTGTGKSLSALAAALDWLDRDPRHTAILTTHTKQLQSQFATEIERLGAAIPGLVDTTDVVKGASNRLSLRGLVYTLADASGSDIGTAGHLVRYTQHSRYRELLAFLVLRLVARSKTPTYRWTASSVDVADIPAFFTSYCGPQLGGWTASLSQQQHGEYHDPSQFPLAAWTNEVREALSAHRVVIANHALLLAHWDDLAANADTTLLIVDEAHSMESAATDALSVELATAEVDDTLASLLVLQRDLRNINGLDRLRRELTELRAWWSDARLRRHVARTFDRSVGDVGVGSRTLTLASPFLTEQPARDARLVAGLLNSLYGNAGRVLGALGDIASSNAGLIDPFVEQRLYAATQRLGALAGAAQELSDTITALFPPPPAPPSAASPAVPSSPAAPAGSAPAAPEDSADGGPDDGPDGRTRSDDLSDDEVAEDEPLESAVSDDEADATVGDIADDGNTTDTDATSEPSSGTSASDDSGTDSGTGTGGGDGGGGGGGGTTAAAAAPVPPVGPPPDRVVYLRESGEIGRDGLEHYRFSVMSSPILLPNDPDWQSFNTTFRRIGLLSATLQVATPGKDSWAYIRTRLGLPDATVTVVDGPFDYAKQARLVAFSDFPSWAEQPKQAMRTVAHQLAGWGREIVHRRDGESGPWHGGAMVLTTARAAAGGIADELQLLLDGDGLSVPVHNQVLLGTKGSVDAFKGGEEYHGGFLVGTRGLWTGVDVSEPGRTNLVWINKLPFPVFTDPVVAARREQIRRAAEQAGDPDPDLVATSEYYLPLAALDLRQAVGRLIRNSGSGGAVVISDRKLSGDLPLRRLYRQIFLGSLDGGLHVADPDTGEATGGNVVPMEVGWQRIWDFAAEQDILDDTRAKVLCQPEELERHAVLPATLEIRKLALTDEHVAQLRADGHLREEVLARATRAATLLTGKERTLRDAQREAIAAVADNRDVLALLPTGSGKSFCFQLPALVLPGLTLVISPLVSLMHDQALSLNHTIGGAVRALVGSLPESSSRAGRTEVIEQMTGVKDHKIRIVYVSPERLSQARFRDALRRGVAGGHIRRVAIDEAHTYVQWGEDFRPSFRRAGALLRTLRAEHPDKVSLMTLTATATPTVEEALREEVLAGLIPGITGPAAGTGAAGQTVSTDALEVVRVNPLRPELTLARRTLSGRGAQGVDALAEQVIDAATGHLILYCLTVRQVEHVYAHLRDYLDGRPVLLRRFHGRLTEVEKASVSNEFSDAPHLGEEDYAQMIVVATSAFGLGVSRDDIRTVFCISPPTDLAALYQQLGRGGRDMAGRDFETVTDVTFSLALATSKTLDTAEWMAQQDLPLPLLREFAAHVLTAAASGTLDIATTTNQLLNAHLAAQTITAAQARDHRFRDSWKVGLTRAVAALADLGVLDDLGDIPARIALAEGTREPATPLAVAVRDAIVALPVRGDHPVTQTIAPLTDLDAYLRSQAPVTAAGYAQTVGNVADLWLLLSDLHDAGAIDVSQRPNTHMLVGLARPHGAGSGSGEGAGGAIPPQFDQRVSGKLARAAVEAAHLRGFFMPGQECLNVRLARYFRVDVPGTCCSVDSNRCSVCAVGPDGNGLPDDGPVPALINGRLRPAAFDPAVRAARVDDAVVRLLRGVFNGATSLQIRLALRGEDRVWVPRLSRFQRLPGALTDSGQFGQIPGLTERELTDSIGRLTALAAVVADDQFWRTASNAARGPRRPRPRRAGP
jgi:Rad3-related DNA helicase